MTRCAVCTLHSLQKLGMAGEKWENRFMVNNVRRSFKVHARRAGVQSDTSSISVPSGRAVNETKQTQGCRSGRCST